MLVIGFVYYVGFLLFVFQATTPLYRNCPFPRQSQPHNLPYTAGRSRLKHVHALLQVLSKGLTLLDLWVHEALLRLWCLIPTSSSFFCLSLCPPPPLTPPRERLVQRMYPGVGAPFESSSPTSRGQWWDYYLYIALYIQHNITSVRRNFKLKWLYSN